MTLIVDRPDTAEPLIADIEPDREEFAQIIQALNRLGITLKPAPEWPGEWSGACPMCALEGIKPIEGVSEIGDGSLCVYPWPLPEYAGSMAMRCSGDRHHLYDIGAPLGIRTRLMTGILAGRAELRSILRAFDLRNLRYESRPESSVGDSYHVAQCPICVKNGHTALDVELMVDDLLDSDNDTFGHVTSYCGHCHQRDAPIAELGIVTRLALRRMYGAIDWASADPEPTWLIEPLVEPGQFVEIYGPAGAGKSLLAQEQAFRLAEQGHRVLYLDHENAPAEVKKRRLAMGRLGAPPEGLIYLTYPPISALDTPAGAARFHALVEASQANVVFLDTWSKFVDGDEASPSTHTAVYNLAIIPLRRQGITVVALDHSGKELGRGPRGGSSKVDNVDVLWLLTSKSNGRLRLERRKTRTGRGPDIVELERLAAPLRHERAQQRASDVLTPEVRACIGKLDELEVPPGWGRERTLKLLRVNEYKIRNDTLNTALRIRRERGDVLADTVDLADDEAA